MLIKKYYSHYIDNKFLLTIYSSIVCFFTYALVYAFRVPFTSATYSHFPSIWGFNYKDVLVILQLFGYSLSKVFGIYFIAELPNTHREKLLIILIVLSWISLFFFRTSASSR